MLLGGPAATPATGTAVAGTTIAALCGFAFLAGFTDSIVGGGGLIQVPALLVLLPGAPVPVLFGTNKLAASMGTTAATVRYARGLRIDWRVSVPAAVASFAFSFLGARAVSTIDESVLRPLVLVLLVGVGVYTWRARDFGAVHAPKLSPREDVALALAAGAALGFYDGFFGPGTGSFLIFVFVSLFGFDFLAATSSAKVVNLGSNLSALLYFGATGQILYRAALPMGVCSVAGATLGSRLALTRGTRLVRGFFLLIVAALIVRLGYDLL
ncbi:MAG TPA: TSUP family transporter [Gemmatimonadales bacterium]|nr:TSUP family transporter [Gemmatimonadales bacterium]